MLNIKVSKRTIQKYMQAARSKQPAGQSWSTFLKTHGKDIWACDFLPVVTLFFRTLHAFVIVHHESRRVVHVGVTDHPTDEWITQQHQGIAQRIPAPRVPPPGPPKTSRVTASPVLNGLHHDYRWAAA